MRSLLNGRKRVGVMGYGSPADSSMLYLVAGRFQVLSVRTFVSSSSTSDCV